MRRGDIAARRRAARARHSEADTLLDSMSESQWQDSVIDVCQRLGYRVYGALKSARRIPNADGGERWVKNYLGDGKGWPDVVAFQKSQPYRRFAFELKDENPNSKPSPEQVEWLEALDAHGFLCYVLRPRDRDNLERLLQGLPWVDENILTEVR